MEEAESLIDPEFDGGCLVLYAVGHNIVNSFIEIFVF